MHQWPGCGCGGCRVTTNIDLAKKVASVVQMRSVTLTRALIESELDPVAPPPNIKISSRHRCRHQHDVGEDVNRIRVFADFMLEVIPVSEAGEAPENVQPAVSLEATFQLIYDAPLGQAFDVECLEQFAQVNGAYNSWPYWRELVQTATGRVGLSGVMVPVYRPQVREMPAVSEDGTPRAHNTRSRSK